MKNPFKLLSERPLRLPRMKPYVPQPDDPSIYWFNSERAEIIEETGRRVAEQHSTTREHLEIVLNDAAIHESARLEKQRDFEAEQSLGFWRGLSRRIARMSDSEKRDAAARIATRFAKDVAGNFDPRVYGMSRHVVPRLLTGVMRPSELPAAMRAGGTDAPASSSLDRLIRVEGNVDRLRRLQKDGTLVYVPTHSSNLDSIVLGRAMELSNLSPVVYGAGKNLFTNPIISFFMHNLGAYRVDRRIRARIYKDVLKMYSQVMIERGYHSLFFPGGTRSRSNHIEQKLKLGLAGSAVNAFAHNQVRGVARRVYFVPTTINYELVLEAETLSEDWLKERGSARYIIEDDEFSRIDRWVSFFRKVTTQDSACVVRFGDPIDPFGNPVADDGRSLGPSGEAFNPRSYVERRGIATLDSARDAAYTTDLGEVLVEQYPKNTVIMATALVAHVLYRRLVRQTLNMDLFSRLRLRGEVSVARDELIRDVGETRDRLRKLEQDGQVFLSHNIRHADPDSILRRALDVWNGYHNRTAAKDLGVEVTVEDPALLLYYQNRLVNFAESIAGPSDIEAAREIGSTGVGQ
ncbi:MAG: glycerol-3-phosphate O-acyltransferase [Polyangiales bacterium]|jgi:glycerol-3-phosphate O-acyltransferase